MKNFLEFIESDTKAKETLLSSMPLKTKTNRKKFNLKVEEILEKYKEYDDGLNKYLVAKSKKFEQRLTKPKENNILKELEVLEKVKFFINFRNTYFEKLRFDNVLFELNNYTDFNFNQFNEIIKQFFDVFKTIGINLSVEDLSYTTYVRDYFKAYLPQYNNNEFDYKTLNKVFEKIYWLNPKIVEHIELNFLKIINNNKSKLKTFISNEEVRLKNEAGIVGYQDCLTKIKNKYLELKETEKETINDIVKMAKDSQLDPNDFFDDSRNKTAAYSSIVIKELDFKDNVLMEKFYSTLEKLKINLEEYRDYLYFKPMIDNFHKTHKDKINAVDSQKKKRKNNETKKLNAEIRKLEKQLSKINRKINSKEKLTVSAKTNFEIKQLKIDSNKLADSLYSKYKEEETFVLNERINEILNPALTVAELLDFYYSFDSYKKVEIKNIIQPETYEELISLSERFDLFAMNPTNIITKGALVFEEIKLDEVILNKYRLDNINITIEMLDIDEIEILLDKIMLILRDKIIIDSKLSVEELWFIFEISKLKL